MGMLIEGIWADRDAVIENGRFIRPNSSFRDTISDEVGADHSNLKGRYMLFASLSCPWSHRTTLAHALKDLSAIVGLHIVGEPRTQGYALDGGRDIIVPGIAHRVRFLHQLYSACDPGYTGRVTVPVLWDGGEGRIVNNESSDILRILNADFDRAGVCPIDLYPEADRATIDHWNSAIYRTGSTMASIVRVLRKHNPHMMKRFRVSLPCWMIWNCIWRTTDISRVIA